jgi:putative transposase
MSDQYWLSEAQLERIKPYFPRSHGRPRVDDRRVIGGIVHVIRNGLRWRDAPEVYGRTRRYTTASCVGHG